jgi:hypothetical protein
VLAVGLAAGPEAVAIENYSRIAGSEPNHY